MKKIHMFVFFAFLFFIVPAYAQEDARNIGGYGKTLWGMTEEQVLKTEAPRVEKLATPKKYKSGTGTLYIPELNIANSRFDAVFIFDEANKKLVEVILASYEEKNAGVNSLTFSSIEKLLTEKYGPPTFKNAGKKISWKLTKTIIELEHLNIPRIVSKITISYEPSTASKDASSNL